MPRFPANPVRPDLNPLPNPLPELHPNRLPTHLLALATAGAVGFGLHEHAFVGPFTKYGMDDAYGGAR